MKFFNFGDEVLVPLDDIRSISKFMKPADLGFSGKQPGIKLTLRSGEAFTRCWEHESYRDLFWAKMERDLKALCKGPSDFDGIRRDLQRIVQEADNEP